MKIKENVLDGGGKILVLTLTPQEAGILTMNIVEGQPSIRYWFDAIHNDTEYNVGIEVDWSHDGSE